MSAFDHAAVHRAAAGVALRLPRGPQRGRLGDVRANSVGSSMELHDFRAYHPGDDVRHLDWNAAARLGELIVRVRHEEVSPRVEVIVDASKSMAVTQQKVARAREVAAWLCVAASRAGLEVAVTTLGAVPRKLLGTPAAVAWLEACEFDGAVPMELALRHAPPLRATGLRVVVSDFLFETDPLRLATTLSGRAGGLALVQLLAEVDVAPNVGVGARLVDAESGEVIERVLTEDVVSAYLERLRAHVRQWEAAAARVRGQWLRGVVEAGLEGLARGPLAVLVEAQ